MEFSASSAYLGNGSVKKANSLEKVNNNSNGVVVQKEPDKKPSFHNIFDAAKIGYYLRCVALIERDGTGILSEFDSDGYTGLHWAALGGYSDVVQLFIDHCAPLDQQSKNTRGQTPIHWACVNGHLQVVDMLIQAGVSINTADNKGCTALIIAAKRGQVPLAGYLMGKGAKLTICDKDGDNALHWAAFQGNAEMVTLLLYSGFNIRQVDNFNQNCLHLASLTGDYNTVTAICEHPDKVDLECVDKNHRTPLTLATVREHVQVTSYLRDEINRRKLNMPKFSFKYLFFGPPGNSKIIFMLFFALILLFAYPMYLWLCLPATYSIYRNVHILFLLTNLVMWYSFLRGWWADPGVIPTHSPQYHDTIRQIPKYAEWKHANNPLMRLCHTCRILKPYRAKHCRVCNRCVYQMDHHCPYIYNCVGYYNRHYFVIFVSAVFLNGLIGEFFAYHQMFYEDWSWLALFGAIVLNVFLAFVGVMFFIAWHCALTNLNANERANYKRYDYLKNESGEFYNPFNKGVWRNLLEFFHLRASRPSPSLPDKNRDL